MDIKPICLIIGAGDYIGAAIAKRFAGGGYHVVMGRRQGEKLAPLISEIKTEGGSAQGFTWDARCEETTIEMFTKASRQELVDKESLEIDIINEFLPSQLDEEQTKEACKIAIKDLEVDSIKAMGKVVKYLKDQHGGSVDMSLASKIIKEILQN